MALVWYSKRCNRALCGFVKHKERSGQRVMLFRIRFAHSVADAGVGPGGALFCGRFCQHVIDRSLNSR